MTILYIWLSLLFLRIDMFKNSFVKFTIFNTWSLPSSVGENKMPFNLFPKKRLLNQKHKQF